MAEPTLAELIAASRRGDSGAFERAFAEIYDELRRVARCERRRLGAGETLSTTAVVHEAFLRLSAGQDLTVEDHHHLVALAARAMRHVLVDTARARLAAKRGGGAPVEELDSKIAGSDALAEEMLSIDRALERLEALDERLARLVEWRYFGGMTDRELAAALTCNERTVRRDWQKARAFLVRELGPGPATL